MEEHFLLVMPDGSTGGLLARGLGEVGLKSELVDGVFTSPFSLAELVARLRALSATPYQRPHRAARLTLIRRSRDGTTFKRSAPSRPHCARPRTGR